MIGRILMCDRCGESLLVGALPAATGTATRKVANSGSIRKVTLGHHSWGHYTVRSRPVNRDLCAGCRTPTVIAEAQAREVHYAAKWNTTWTPKEA
jgi:hypothetical protein